MGQLQGSQPILDIEKQLSQDYQKRSGTKQRSQIKKKERAINVISRTKGVDTGYSDEKIEDQGTEGWDSLRAGTIDMEEDIREAGRWAVGVLAVDESSWPKKHEAEE